MPETFPATGAADRVELPNGWYRYMAGDACYFGNEKNGDVFKMNVGRCRPEFDDLMAALKPSSGAGAAGLEIGRLRVELADVSAYAHKLQVALTGLARGGSENFVRHGDGYRADIPFCTAKINSRFYDMVESFKAELLARRKADATIARQADDLERLRKLDEALAGLRALSERATSGPWHVVQLKGYTDDEIRTAHPDFQDKPHGNYVGGTGLAAGHREQRFSEDSALIVAAVNLVRAQIARPSADQREGADEGGGR